ncbi:MAG: biotin carboxylase N-terminal domain-containing protein, partial [Pseudomonadota bacterium]
MFTKILIANRGEIACRVIDTARRMGVATVAVYSDADRGARHADLADEAVHIGAAPARDSYLKIDAIVEGARSTGAQAVHPGYGFLSENPEFVDALEAAGLTFIGPSASAIRAMGLKDAAKRLMEEAGVPVVPGYHGDNQDPAFLATQAEAIGYPVLIKASAGGGGKGMRLVDGAPGFADALASAQREAEAAFGNRQVLVEKFIQSPRHIEIQVFGDGTRAIHLFERDCSLQRRHQKVIEEAPAPGMTAAVRDAMGQAAVRAAEAIGYKGAGTVEFIVDGSGNLRPDGFWFMEMNTRLQVEHPVTEEITGIDLVEWQLRVAAGAPLPASQEDLAIRGHAFEARIYAEDAAKRFMPQTGRIDHLAFPADARVDTGVRPGDRITPFYDPMIAKVTVHGTDRPEALAKLSRALAATEITGTTTNTAFLGALAAHAGFGRGQVDTGLIDRDLESLIALPDVRDHALALAALVALGLLDDAPAQDPWARRDGWRLWGSARQR